MRLFDNLVEKVNSGCWTWLLWKNIQKTLKKLLFNHLMITTWLPFDDYHIPLMNLYLQRTLLNLRFFILFWILDEWFSNIPGPEQTTGSCWENIQHRECEVAPAWQRKHAEIESELHSGNYNALQRGKDHLIWVMLVCWPWQACHVFSVGAENAASCKVQTWGRYIICWLE